MENNQEVCITVRDRVLRAWENSMEMVRDFEGYAHAIRQPEIRKLFEEFAKDEGAHAAQLRAMLLEDQSRKS